VSRAFVFFDCRAFPDRAAAQLRQWWREPDTLPRVGAVNDGGLRDSEVDGYLVKPHHRRLSEVLPFPLELFPAKIRYTSLSIPYHIGNGWFGGFLPLIAATLLASTGNLYAGLIFPIVVAVMTVIIGGLFIRESRHVKIWDEVGGETENVRVAAAGG
jgi:hypothetical protein